MQSFFNASKKTKTEVNRKAEAARPAPKRKCSSEQGGAFSPALALPEEKYLQFVFIPVIIFLYMKYNSVSKGFRAEGDERDETRNSSGIQ